MKTALNSLILLFILSKSIYASEVFTIPVIKPCLEQTLKRLEMHSKNKDICKTSEYLPFTETHASANDVIGYIKISENEKIEDKYISFCKNNLNHTKNNMRAYSSHCVNTSKLQFERTGNLDKDLKSLKYHINKEVKMGRDTHNIIITESEISINRKEISNN